MKIEDYDSIIKKLSNPDTMADGLVDLNSQLQKDLDDYKAVKASNDTLRDTNSKLALRITERVNIDESNDSEQQEPDPFETLVNNLTEVMRGDNNNGENSANK